MDIRSTFLVVFILLQYNGFGQRNLDSLFAIWQNEDQTDSVRVKAFTDYIWSGFLYTNADSANTLADQMIAFSRTKGYDRGESVGFNTKGAVNQLTGNYPLALNYFLKAMEIIESTGDSAATNALIMNLGIIYSDKKDFNKALEYYTKGLIYAEKLDNKNVIAICLINMSSAYRDLGLFNKALESAERSMRLSKEFGWDNILALSYSSIGSVYKQLENYPKALNFLNKALELDEIQNERRGMAANLSFIGDIYHIQGQYDLALKYCKKALGFAKEINHWEPERMACQCLYDTYKALKEGNKALFYIERVQEIDDSLKTDETLKNLQQMEFEKQVLVDSLEKADEARLIQEAHEDEVAKKNNTRNMLIGGGLLALIFAGGFFSRWRYVKRSKAVIEEEKERSENLLLNILPEEIAAELKQKGKADARDFDRVSILFTDFQAFTQMSEQMGAKELVAEMNHCFKAFDEICEKYGVEKIKTIGDSYMAAGGLPVPSDDSVKKAVLVGVEMADFIVKRKEERKAQGQIGFEMRCGIHTGNVVAGIIGVKKFQYDVWGDTVNTASRMESHGEVGKVNISQATYELIKDDPQFVFESRGRVEAKGKGEVDMYFVGLA